MYNPIRLAHCRVASILIDLTLILINLPTSRHNHHTTQCKMPTATPSRGRPRSTTPPLPPYEPPLIPLHNTGHAKLITLLKSQSLRQLKTHLQHAEEKLTDSAGEVNERLTDSRLRYEKQKERRRARRPRQNDSGEQAESAAAALDDADDNDDGDEEHERLMQLEEQVTGVTGQLEAAMRRTIDAEVKVDSLAGVMGRFETEAEQASLAPRRATRRTRRHINADEDGDDDGDGDDADYDPAEGEGAEAPSQKLQTSLAESNARWDGLSLTERYASRPTYMNAQALTSQIRDQQRLHRLLPDHPRSQTPRRRHPAAPARLNMVHAPGRAGRRRRGRARASHAHTGWPTRSQRVPRRLGRHRHRARAHLAQVPSDTAAVPRPRDQHEMPAQFRA